MENRNLKVSFSKSGSGSLTPRLSLPITWIREMSISEEDREVIVSLCEDFIIIRKNIKYAYFNFRKLYGRTHIHKILQLRVR